MRHGVRFAKTVRRFPAPFIDGRQSWEMRPEYVKRLPAMMLQRRLLSIHAGNTGKIPNAPMNNILNRTLK
jgi:hypothetical protein